MEEGILFFTLLLTVTVNCNHELTLQQNTVLQGQISLASHDQALFVLAAARRIDPCKRKKLNVRIYRSGLAHTSAPLIILYISIAFL